MTSLRESFQLKPSLVICGAFDGLTARLVERGGFDGVWASGFCISASKGEPDANVLTINELVDRVAEMAKCVSIPIIVDCDEGYGDIQSTIRLVKELAEIGVQAVCIEDNCFPKLNSFLADVARRLVPVQTHCERIRAVKEAVPEMMVIARTEAIIAGLSVDHGVARGKAYGDAGADLVLIHSRYTELDQFRELAAKWDGRYPLVVVPTLATSLDCRDFADVGYRMVIFANQVLRVCVLGAETMLGQLRETGSQKAILPNLTSLEHIFELTGLTANGAGSLRKDRDAAACVPESSGVPVY
ncbi:MAG: isocitrate lyase/phosphoenolpyruvate mutase family protein [Isosphaeraceae bacterium]|nr:isocitrate lyase/phosphoenolpyruvate mutase family protein [Isosphaeraceae bacterium]